MVIRLPVRLPSRLRLPSVQHSWRHVPKPGTPIALSVLLTGTAYLSWRYYTSAAFEHSVVFSLCTLIWCAIAAIVLAAWSARRGKPIRALLSVVLKAPSSRFLSLVGFVVGRTLLFDATLDNTHCLIEGIYAFLPALLAVLDAVSPTLFSTYEALPSHEELDDLPPLSPSSPLSHAKKELPRNGVAGLQQHGGPTRGSVVRYVILALTWGFSAHQTLVFMERPTGAICPSYGGWDQLIPASQILMMIFDTLVIVQVARSRRGSTESVSDGGSSWAFVGALCLSSAWALMLAVFVLGIYHRPFAYLFSWAPSVHQLIRHDLLYDSLVAAAVLISAISLLSSAHPATLAVVTVAAGIYFHYIKQLRDENGTLFTSAPAGMAVRIITVVAIFLLLLLIRSDTKLPFSGYNRPSGWTAQRWLTLCYAGFVIALLVRQSKSTDAPATAVTKIISTAQKESRLWVKEASRSESMYEAANEYRMRYGIPPPPNFDKWYEFAVQQQSKVIDSFDQIHDDLLPFWGLPPALLRERTTHLLEQTRLGIGGFRIRDHKVTLSPHTPGTHFWMMEGFQAMVEPFLRWLPDMDLAFNLDDECRVIVPFEEMQTLKDMAKKAQKRVPLHNVKSFSAAVEPAWSDSYMADDWKDRHGEDISPSFSFRNHHSILDTYIASTCPPTSPALTTRWWSRKAALPAGRGVVSDLEAYVDLCQRPDIARMHGFLLDPGAFAVTRTLFPIFSQSRISGFADVLVPSPWNFMSKVDLDEAADRPWAAKLNSVFWRGSSSDGLSTRGTWATFLRARFVSLAQRAARAGKVLAAAPAVGADSASARAHRAVKSSLDPAAAAAALDTRDLTVNVSFVGNFTKCHRPDCLAQSVAFYGVAELQDPPAGMGFQEHWAHRHLVDLDGAGFSGRFIPFLKSRSLVYRASLFRTWYDERVHPWRHYAPLDISLVDLWGLMKWLGWLPGRVVKDGGGGEGEKNDGDRQVSMGEQIALDGREWALQALRKEDMQVYMFRLLLEWGRLIDDKREELGFE